MTNPYAFHKQAEVPFISEAEIEAFSMERFRFAQQAAGSDDVEAVRDAAVSLLETAMGEQKPAPRTARRAAAAYDDTIW